MTTPPRDKRRQIIVDAPAQKRMVLRSTLVPLTVMLIGAVGMLLVSEQAFEQAGDLEGGSSALTLLVICTIGYIVTASAVAIWLSLRQSHRVAGPAHRLQKFIERIRAGDLDFEVTLRAGDELVELARELDRLVKHLREQEANRAKAEIPSEQPAEETVH